MIEFMRIDDRYVHGQIATTWVRHIAPEALILVDDDIAQNDMRRGLMKMSAPKDIPLAIYTVEQAIKKLNGSLRDNELFVLVGNTKTALDICLACRPVSLDLGNMGYKEGLENLINRIWVSEEDKKNIGEIQRAGVRVFAQMLPNNAQDPIPQL